MTEHASATYSLSGSPEAATASSPRVEIEPVAGPEHWQALLARVPHAHSVQAFGYGAAKAETGWRAVRLMLSIAGRPVAMVQALEKRLLGLRLVTRINRGPMFFEAKPADAEIVAVYRALRRHFAPFHFGVLLIAPALEDNETSRALLARAGFHRRKGNGWGSARLDLAQPIDAVFQGFEHSWRKAIRASQKEQVTIRVTDEEADHRWMIERHLGNMAQKGFSGHGAEFLSALRRHSGTDYVLLQAIHEGRAVAGLVMLKFGTTADSIVAWFGDEGRKVKAGNAITWGAICEMQRRGCTSYDVGGIVADKGFVSFKSGMNGTEYFLLGEYWGF